MTAYADKIIVKARRKAESDAILERQREERLRRYSDGSRPRERFVEGRGGWYVVPVERGN